MSIDNWGKKYNDFCRKIIRLKTQMENEKAFSKKLYDDFYRLNRWILEEAENEAQKLKEKKGINAFIVQVRKDLGEYFYSSTLFKYSFTKPQGYPGDFRMMDFIYNNQRISETLIGQYYDQFYLDNPYAEAVRCRKDKMVVILKDILDKKKESRILNIACGPSREVKELFENQEDNDYKIEMLAVDHDQDALDFSKKQLQALKKKLTINFHKADVFKYFRHPAETTKNIGEFNLVYSTGLADYLPDLLFVKMLKFFYFSLKPNGKFILAHKIEDKDPFAPITPKFICDWHFNKRTEVDLARALQKAEINDQDIESQLWDRSNRIKFIIVRKS
jgi:extracellular factor (EF) 3-hydroxypalmitic acid methyl ester biosynthesis protein